MTGEYQLRADASGMRLDRFLGVSCPELTRTRAQKLITAGLIMVNGEAAKSGQRLVAGDRVAVTIPPEPASPLSPEAVPNFKLVFGQCFFPALCL